MIPFEEALKDSIKKCIDRDYTKYKEEKLKELDFILESKRNENVTEMLNGISIMEERNPYGLEPIINIRVENKRYINK